MPDEPERLILTDIVDGKHDSVDRCTEFLFRARRSCPDGYEVTEEGEVLIVITDELAPKLGWYSLFRRLLEEGGCRA